LRKLTRPQFKKYCDIVYNESGINLTEEKRELLNARIGKRLRKLSLQPDKYLILIQKDPQEMKNFLDAVSTNHTYFFRESKSFKYLDKGCRDIWCAACSSGEESYSIAIYCMELGFRPSIFATDISNSCLEKGKTGIYPMKCISNIPKNMLIRYFQKGQGKWDCQIRVRTDIRRVIKFERFNLLKDTPPSRNFDIIFCRNVMIYFDNSSKESVLNKLAGVLKHGGYFIIGGAESLSGLNHRFKYIEPSVYKKC
jgi:chemotaxis protein methyltransferase CheR